MAPVMQPVYSTNISAVGHDPETQEMHVTWNSGRTSIYDGVPTDVADRVRRSSSVTQAVNETIKGTYPHRYVK